jgi:VWFA-related protein
MLARLAVLVGVVTVLAAAQDQPPEPTFHTEANYVRVDVLPTKDGAPVTDLTQSDFDVLEGGATQRIEQFEHVVIHSAGAQEARIEPNTVRESRAMQASARARLFVLFLDTYHVEIAGSHNIRRPLVDALDRVIGPDDLVGVMTPDMSPTDIAFARKTTTIDGFLTRYWNWGERDQIRHPEPEDQEYAACYPNSADGSCADQNGIAAEMIDRRHEKRTLDALVDLARFLRGAREERKAILAITDGWLLFHADQSLTRPLSCQGVPGPAGVSVDPRTGRLTTKDPSTSSAPSGKCNIDRMRLAQIDDDREFRDLLDEANRANASFYPIDPRGLAVFDTPLVRQDVQGAPPPLTPISVDGAMLRARLNALRTLADATDGLAIVNSNDLAGGLRRVVADLSSYYLLGYYSTGKLDGKFHAITVRVKRPGVQVRARRGYLAGTPGEATAAAARVAAGASPGTSAEAEPAAATEARAVDSAIASLAGYTGKEPLRVQVAAGWKTGAVPSPALWVEGELGSDATLLANSKDAGEATVTIADTAGNTLAISRVALPQGSRSFRVALQPAPPLTTGEYVVRVGLGSGDAATTVPSRDLMHISVPAASTAVGAIFIRRGPSTGNKDVPTADLRFRRSERVRVEIPTLSTAAAGARLLDRTGKPLAVPVAAALREDTDGSRWQTGELTLAPLAQGDYVIELSDGDKRTLAAFRVVP